MAHRSRAVLVRAAPACLAILVGIGGGFASYQFGITIWTPDWAYATDTAEVRGTPTADRPVRPSLGRVLDDTQNSGFSAQAGGRFASYGLAFVQISASPWLGHGIGEQARIPWAWGGFRAREAGQQPGVDNAYLTVGLKSGAIGIAVFAAMVLWPLRQALAKGRRRLRPWFVPAWIAILGLTVLQSFAVGGYAPYVLALLMILPAERGGGLVSVRIGRTTQVTPKRSPPPSA